MEKLLRYEHVSIAYDDKPVVQDVSFTLEQGEILGIAGESGCGKTTLLKAAMGLLDKKASLIKGDIYYKGKQLVNISEKEQRELNGPELGMIFQNSGSSFCPVRTVGAQLYEIMTQHTSIDKADFKRYYSELFERLGFEDTERIFHSYPFELSGGMQQRVGIGAAMLLKPSVLFADEPTAALDVSVQKQVINELISLREIYNTAVILVSHNIGIIKKVADKVMVMKAGRMLEYGEKHRILENPQSDYTKMLLAAVPGLRRV